MAITSKKVYISRSGFYALINRAHPKYEQASAYFRYFAIENYLLFTDIFTLNDVYNQIYREISPSLSKDFLRTVFLSDLNILYPEERDVKAALKTLINFQSSDLTFNQSLRAVLANRREVSQVLTFDYLHPLFGQGAFYLPM